MSVYLQFRDQKRQPRDQSESFIKVFPLAFTHFGTHQKPFGELMWLCHKNMVEKMFERQGKNDLKTHSWHLKLRSRVSGNKFALKLRISVPVEVRWRIYAICPLSLVGKMSNNFDFFLRPKISKVSVWLQFRALKRQPRDQSESFIKVFPLAFTHFGTHQKPFGELMWLCHRNMVEKNVRAPGEKRFENA